MYSDNNKLKTKDMVQGFSIEFIALGYILVTIAGIFLVRQTKTYKS